MPGGRQFSQQAVQQRKPLASRPLRWKQLA
jgi:hypothetical protein